MPRKGGEKRKFSLLHLITTLNVGGAEISLLKLVSGMDGSRFRNHVVCLAEEGPVGARIRSQGIPVQALNMPRGRVTIRGLMQLQKLLRRINPDIFQTWMYHADLIGLLLGSLAQELGPDYEALPTFIGYIARFDPMKDHRTFMEAASRLSSALPLPVWLYLRRKEMIAPASLL